MNKLGKNISISLLLGGLWGIILQSIFSTFSIHANLLSNTFYPILFLGFLFVSAFYFDIEMDISLEELEQFLSHH